MIRTCDRLCEACGTIAHVDDFDGHRCRPRPPTDAYGPPWVYHDGGRADAGFKGDAGDCVTRAIAIALNLPYRDVYDELAERTGQTKRKGKKRSRSARDGVPRTVYDPYLAELGWTWTPTMTIGSGTTFHVRPDEIPDGRAILRLSKHLTAVVDGVVYDTSDPSRSGTRAVYGWWTP